MSDEHLEWLKKVTTFNLETRYNGYKLEFYKKAVPDYTKRWDSRCEGVYQWLLKKY